MIVFNDGKIRFISKSKAVDLLSDKKLCAWCGQPLGRDNACIFHPIIRDDVLDLENFKIYGNSPLSFQSNRIPVILENSIVVHKMHADELGYSILPDDMIKKLYISDKNKDNIFKFKRNHKKEIALYNSNKNRCLNGQHYSCAICKCSLEVHQGFMHHLKLKNSDNGEKTIIVCDFCNKKYIVHNKKNVLSDNISLGYADG